MGEKWIGSPRLGVTIANGNRWIVELVPRRSRMVANAITGTLAIVVPTCIALFALVGSVQSGASFVGPAVLLLVAAGLAVLADVAFALASVESTYRRFVIGEEGAIIVRAPLGLDTSRDSDKVRVRSPLFGLFPLILRPNPLPWSKLTIGVQLGMFVKGEAGGFVGMRGRAHWWQDGSLAFEGLSERFYISDRDLVRLLTVALRGGARVCLRSARGPLVRASTNEFGEFHRGGLMISRPLSSESVRGAIALVSPV
jgi:hypothetical protein